MTRSNPVHGRLAGQTVVVIGASAGIGLETARLVRANGGQVVMVGRDPNASGRPRTNSGR
ncbi:hypothetical protein [Streptomyces wuyuanensis]|uniref:hypothetical protein n=1 Tax=Streptomyces wuyuanensis TaxID=1196353 RepID=UPI00379164D7